LVDTTKRCKNRKRSVEQNGGRAKLDGITAAGRQESNCKSLKPKEAWLQGCRGRKRTSNRIGSKAEEEEKRLLMEGGAAIDS
jgi:hypothetical protein